MKQAQIISLAFFGLMFVALFFYARTEAYCFFAPAIDTQFAAGFSETSFAEITIGMSAEMVRKKLGEPLRKHFHTDKETWCYTLDGKCWWGDWAWLCREVTIQRGFVTEVVKRVNYD